ncbi:hypothetical protein ASC97_05800 [Rhizobium sp. Root1203]|uniref:helix-turn-helix domain-containing protein n=1 Tax=Rhizobium sp. Root1203 TaxID=1736427 RepID=UPI00070B2A5B|nr:helix-turn-helix transcriptional regulator [Rhizobium sp. Root1203]KQV27875.1 hypothetical protein ASC97_05800 [Rhizobium sp. Root1203]
MLDIPTRAVSAIKTKSPSPVDAEIGGRIRMRRKLLGMSQTDLGAKLGVTFQQIQKYEKGTNRVGGSRMQRIAEVLGAPVGFFFESSLSQGATVEESEILSFASTSEGLDLIRAFSKIQSSKARRQIIGIAQTVASQGTEH